MSQHIRIIDATGKEIPESKNLAFNYISNPFAFAEVVKANTGVDIRQLPFFPDSEDFQNQHPNQERKQQMLEQAQTIVRIFSELATIKFVSPLESWLALYAEDYGPFVENITFSGTEVICYAPKEADRFGRVGSHNDYIEWTKSFLELLTLLQREGHGFLVSEL
jgi:hypothetical protein